MSLLIWLALLIPFLVIIVIWYLGQKVPPWPVLVVPPLLTATLILLVQGVTEYSQVADTEYWTNWVVKAEYYEHWNELHEWDETYTETVPNGTDSKGKPKTKTVTKKRHHKDVIDHPAKWDIIDNDGHCIVIDQAQFETLSGKFKNRKFVAMHHIYHTVNGDKYEAIWPGDDASLEAVVTTHTYENRIIASNSIFKFRSIDKHEKESYHLFDYPKVQGYTAPSVLGFSNPSAERKFDILNARYGKSKQIRIWVLVFRNQPLEAAFAQQAYWQGGNKNELVLCIGIDDDNKVLWGHVFSWSERETLKLEVRDLIQEGKELNLSEIATKLEPIVANEWERKHFKDFQYIAVEPTAWAVGVTYTITLLGNVGLLIWFITQNKKLP